jgi:hypothetical protein
MIVLDEPALQSELKRFGAAMARYVDEQNQNAAVVVKTQVGRLMREIADQMPPKNRARLESIIRKDVRGVFHPRTREMFKGDKAGNGDMVWLDVGPDHITGVPKNLFRPKSSVGEMASMFKARVKKMGAKYVALGLRGKQHVQKLNRIVVKPNVLARFENLQKLKVGKLKASFALAWDTIRPAGRRPAKWVMRHIDNKTAKGSFVDGLRRHEMPTFTIISNQPGCESQRAIAVVKAALISRTESMKADLAKWFRKRKHA